MTYEDLAYCWACDYDEHTCHGCGTPVAHDQLDWCDRCYDDYAEE